MRVVIDTNVVVSAAIKNRTPEEVLQYVVGHPDWEWVVSAEILAEYKEVLGREKFSLPAALRRRWDVLLDSVTVCIDVPPGLDFPRDPADAKFLACALAANAEWLVTGDQDLTQARKLGNTTIISVSLFKKHVCAAL